ncbi:transcriptional regulator [Lactococcus hodotermopsidis]|uniref:Transcriptional regulator n=1 Tax=Pseudolactococcus hodotermopsidis TaxID=2709157 RepID=A0A6A0B8B8_9LACT|nr:metalloregulator ArsR/SmtB family transcription factor [Lactococcus hodotermopsidis]GFH41620.1 transcriptional regulator [Lactococcus hodotermopsidis]
MKKYSDVIVKEIVHIHKILANATRVKILLLLSESPLNVSQLAEKLGLEQSAVSHQLKLLKEHLLVANIRVGKASVYQIGDSHILQLLKVSIDHAKELESDHIHDPELFH